MMFSNEDTARIDRKMRDTGKSDAALDKVAEMLKTFDGVSIGDAFKLATLVKEYGDARASESVNPIMDAMLTGITRSLDKAAQPPKEPWQKDEGGPR